MIKFRGKRIDNGERVYGCYCNNTEEHWLKDIIEKAKGETK